MCVWRKSRWREYVESYQSDNYNMNRFAEIIFSNKAFICGSAFSTGGGGSLPAKTGDFALRPTSNNVDHMM